MILLNDCGICVSKFCISEALKSAGWIKKVIGHVAQGTKYTTSTGIGSRCRCNGKGTTSINISHVSRLYVPILLVVLDYSQGTSPNTMNVQFLGDSKRMQECGRNPFGLDQFMVIVYSRPCSFQKCH
jgi:hypothetical protein